MKYSVDITAPIVRNGGSTGFIPTHVRRSVHEMNLQNVNFFVGENFLFIECDFIESTRNLRSAASIIITPPSLLGTERRIAYANRKYHSG